MAKKRIIIEPEQVDSIIRRLLWAMENNDCVDDFILFLAAITPEYGNPLGCEALLEQTMHRAYALTKEGQDSLSKYVAETFTASTPSMNAVKSAGRVKESIS